MIPKIARALVLIPLAIVLVAFAVANRQAVLISLDPFDPAEPAFSLRLPLYVLLLLLLMTGVILGGVAAWLRQSRWRGRARMAEAQVRELKADNDLLKRRATGVPSPAALPGVEHAPRLSIPPPAG